MKKATISDVIQNDVLFYGGHGDDLTGHLIVDERAALVAAGEAEATVDVTLATKLSDARERKSAIERLRQRYPTEFVDESRIPKIDRKDKFALMKAAMKKRETASQLKRIEKRAEQFGQKRAERVAKR